MKLEDLPPAMQRQALAQMGEKPKRSRAGDSRVATDGTCVGCGERFTSTAKWERHSDATGHHRFELNIGATS